MILLAAETTSTAGPVGLFLILGLLVATVLLIRSMNGRLRKLPPSFEPPADSSTTSVPLTAERPAAEPPVDRPSTLPDQDSGDRPPAP